MQYTYTTYNFLLEINATLPTRLVSPEGAVKVEESLSNWGFPLGVQGLPVFPLHYHNY